MLQKEDLKEAIAEVFETMVGKNLNEKPLIQTQIERYRRHDKF